MIDNERCEVALIRVRNGETITAVVKNLYGNRRQYGQRTSAFQQGEIARPRQEYLSTRPDPKRSQPPRFFVETTFERRKAVEEHCQKNGLNIARFVNGAIAEALVRTVSKYASFLNRESSIRRSARFRIIFAALHKLSGCCKTCLPDHHLYVYGNSNSLCTDHADRPDLFSHYGL